MAKSDSHADHDRDHQVALPRLEGKKAPLPLHGEDPAQVLVHHLEEAEVVDHKRTQETHGAEQNRIHSPFCSKPVQGKAEEHDPHADPHEAGKENQHPFAHCRFVLFK